MEHLQTITKDATDFDYMVQIGNNGTWSQAHVDVCEDPNNDPVALNDEAHVKEDQTVTGNVLTNDTDKDAGQKPTVKVQIGGHNIGAAGTVLHGTYGSLTIYSNGTYSYIANTDEAQALGKDCTARDSFSYTAVDSKGGTNAATLKITVCGTNDVAMISGLRPSVL